MKQRQLESLQANKDQRKQPSVNQNANVNDAQIETEALLATMTKPTKPIKPEFVELFENVMNVTVPFVMALVHDYIKIYQILGQEMADTDKYLCTELIFVEKAENIMEIYSPQTFDKPVSSEFKAIIEKSECKEVKYLQRNFSPCDIENIKF